MPLTYSEHSERPASEKVVLAWVEPAQRLVVWAVHSGSIYKKTVAEFVVDIVQEGTSLSKQAALASVNSAGKWFFDPATKIVYVWCQASNNPDVVFIRATYRLFFSNAPYILPYDLDVGAEVEYLPYVISTSDFGYELDYEQMGVAIEGEGDIALINKHGYFDDKFDKYFWENKDVRIYSWSPKIPLSEKKVIYKGLVASKAFSETSVGFGLKDFISKLYSPLAMNFFDGSEGDVQSGDIGRVKRRIYGRVSGLAMVPIDCTLDGFDLTGTVSGVSGASIISGSGTVFLDEVSPEDQISYGEYTYRVKSVDSDTQLTLTSQVEINFTNVATVNKPKVPWRKKNREWFIAEHCLKRLFCTIDTVVQPNRFIVDSTAEFQAGDEVVISGQKNTIRRISGNLIVLQQEISPVPLSGDEIEKLAVQAVNAGTTDFVSIRDYSITNTSTKSSIVFDGLAEFNVTRPSTYIGSATFTNGSRTITGSGTNFLVDFKTRDWIRPNQGAWHEVLSVDSETQLTLRIVFGEATVSSAGQKKNVTYLADSSIVTANCYGRTVDNTANGTWIKTGADVVMDVLSDIGISDNINSSSFAMSSTEADYLVSLKLPVDLGSREVPSAKDVIDLVNESVFGALHFNADFEIEHNVITSKKPTNLSVIKDDDIISWSVTSRLDHIVQEVVCAFRHEDSDRFTQQEAASYVSNVSQVARNLCDAKASLTKNIYLYDRTAATIINYRYALFHESASHRVTIQTKLNLTQKQLTDKVYISFDRLFHRLGSLNSRLKIAGVIATKKNGLGTIIELEDLSNAWNKIANYADDSSLDFATASEDEKVRNGYYNDDNGILTGYDYTYRTNLYG